MFTLSYPTEHYIHYVVLAMFFYFGNWKGDPS